MCPADCLSNYPIRLNDNGVDANAVARSTCMINCNARWEPCILGCGATIEYVEEGQSPKKTAEGGSANPAQPPSPPPFEEDDEVFCEGKGAGEVYELRNGQATVGLPGGIAEVPARLCRRVPFGAVDYVACDREGRGLYYDAFVDRIGPDGTVYVTYDGTAQWQEATSYERCRSRRLDEGETFGASAGGFEVGQRVQCRRAERYLHGWVIEEPKRSHMTIVSDAEASRLYARRDCRVAPEQPAEDSPLGEILSCPDGLFRVDAMIVKDNGDGTVAPFRMRRPRFTVEEAELSDCRRDRPLGEPPSVGDRISCELPGMTGTYQDLSVLSVSGDRLEARPDQGAKLSLGWSACRKIGLPADRLSARGKDEEEK
jgi:hypothetical protein